MSDTSWKNAGELAEETDESRKEASELAVKIDELAAAIKIKSEEGSAKLGESIRELGNSLKEKSEEGSAKLGESIRELGDSLTESGASIFGQFSAHELERSILQGAVSQEPPPEPTKDKYIEALKEILAELKVQTDLLQGGYSCLVD